MVQLLSYPACVVPQGVPMYNDPYIYISMHALSAYIIYHVTHSDCKPFRLDTGASQMSPQLGKQHKSSSPHLPNVVLTATISTMVLVLLGNEPNVLQIRAKSAKFASRLTFASFHVLVPPRLRLTSSHFETNGRALCEGSK